MHNLTLEELHRDILDIKNQQGAVYELSTSELKSLGQLVTSIDRRLTRIEERIIIFSLIVGAVSGLVGQFVLQILPK